MQSGFLATWQQGGDFHCLSQKVVCVGRNFAEHAAELHNPVPTEPVIFIKPSTALVDFTQAIPLVNDTPLHYELELALLIGQPLRRANEAQCLNAVVGYGLALDLTLRQVQQQLKQQGHPWEWAKAFDGSCPVTPFVLSDASSQPLSAAHFQLRLDGRLQQQGEVRQMIFSPGQLLAYISQRISLLPGDIVLTGTPAGVGPLALGSQLQASLNGEYSWATQVVAAR